jgi:Peptidase A4 family
MPGPTTPTPLRAASRPGSGLFTPPPTGFDPVLASDRELLAHGFPARPDRELQPDLYQHWTAMLSRPLTVVAPQFAAITDKRHGGRRFCYANTVGTGWAGSSFVPAAGGDPVTFVRGQWTVPAVVPPARDHGLSSCATRVGIDGVGDDSTDILQTGTTQQITYGDSQVTYAWFEWYPAGAHTISDLAVSPGDVMYAVICVYTSTEAAVYLGNLTTSTLVSFIKDGSAEGGLSVTGASAEWILECPEYQNDDFAILTKFGDVYFDNCFAGTGGSGGGQIVLGGSHAGIVMLGNDDGNIVSIAAPFSLNERAFKVQYVAPG